MTSGERDFVKKVQDTLEAIKYRDWRFRFAEFDPGTGRYFLQVMFTEEGRLHKGRKWALSQWMTKNEIVQTAFKAVMTAEEHEARERFLYQGKAVLGPHLNLEALVIFLGEPRATVDREDPN